MQMTQAVLPIMRAQQHGRIINIASISGTVTGPSQSIYSATKAAVIMMSEALAAEVAPFGIQVTAVGPSGVRTDFLDARSTKRPAKRLPEYQVVAQTANLITTKAAIRSWSAKRLSNWPNWPTLRAACI